MCVFVCGFSQAIAAGLGGVALAAILAALCLNYKHFGGGLPDLLLMRAVRTHGDGGGDPRQCGRRHRNRERWQWWRIQGWRVWR